MCEDDPMPPDLPQKVKDNPEINEEAEKLKKENNG